MQAIDSSRSLQLQTIVTGMHLLKQFGHTVRDIQRDGFAIDARVAMQRGDDSAADQALGLSRGIAGIAKALEKNKTDIVVVLGDRIEAMAGALAATTTGRLLAHIHGGDLAPGDFDDSLRHAITKLAHVHFPATKASARRIIKMGESTDRVHVVGAPGLDDLQSLAEEYKRRGGGRGNDRTVEKRALVVYHSCGRSAAHEKRIMASILRAVDRAKLSATCVYPNTDRGNAGVIEAIEKYADRVDPRRFRVVRSLARDVFLRELIEADVLVGNSSCGIIEAAMAGTASLDIGPRQEGREVSGKSVVHVGESFEAIRAGLYTALRKRPVIGARSVYGDGCAGRLIAKCLARAPLSSAYVRKLNSY
jgi:GDP/UDP-N,N'-diacetylbacillosamine 2-epimerase (hydrolysing)